MCGKKNAALTLVAASADMRDLGAVFDREEPLLHPTCDHAQQNMRDEGYEASPVLAVHRGRVRASARPHVLRLPSQEPEGEPAQRQTQQGRRVGNRRPIIVGLAGRCVAARSVALAMRCRALR